MKSLAGTGRGEAVSTCTRRPSPGYCDTVPVSQPWWPQLTGVRDVVPVGRVKLVLGPQDLLEELGIVLVVERGVTAEPGDGGDGDAHLG